MLCSSVSYTVCVYICYSIPLLCLCLFFTEIATVAASAMNTDNSRTRGTSTPASHTMRTLGKFSKKCLR